MSEYVARRDAYVRIGDAPAVTIEKNEWDQKTRRFRKAFEQNVQATIMTMLISDVGECGMAVWWY